MGEKLANFLRGWYSVYQCGKYIHRIRDIDRRSSRHYRLLPIGQYVCHGKNIFLSQEDRYMTAYQTILIWVLIFTVGFGLALLSQINRKLDKLISAVKGQDNHAP